FRPDPTIWDGRYANNGWLQELPKPLTKLTWDNVAYLSFKTAGEMGLKSGDLIRVAIGERSITAPVWVMPNQPDRLVSLTLGYGRTQSGRVGQGIGYNAYEILPEQSWFTTGELSYTGETYKLATTQ